MAMRLTIYLMDERVSDFEQALKGGCAEGPDAFEDIPLRRHLDLDARAYLQRGHRTTPKWLAFVESHLEISDPNSIYNTNNSLLVLVRVKGRIFAISHGYGHFALDRRRIQRGFGLRTTLNAIDPEKIKSFDVRNIDVVTRQKRTLADSGMALGEFELDFDRDLVRVVAGEPLDSAAGTRMQGSDALSWSGDLEFASLGAKCRYLLEVYQRDTYRERFPFIDHVRTEPDPDVVQALDAALTQSLNERQRRKMSVAYPDMAYWELVGGFRVYQGRVSAQLDEMRLDGIYEFLDAHPKVHVDPHRVKVAAMDDDGRQVSLPETLYDYLVFETEHQGRTFVLTLSRWFEVSRDYVEEVDRAVGDIPRPPDLGLLPMRPGEHEAAYNRRCADASPDLIMMDRQLIRLPGRTSVEVCDLMARTGHLIHVKRKASSATLSHLFAQGVVSASLLVDDADYRSELLRRVPSDWDVPFTRTSVDRGRIACVYAIPTYQVGDPPDVLPFFSKVKLRTDTQTLRRLGLSVQVQLVPFE